MVHIELELGALLLPLLQLLLHLLFADAWLRIHDAVVSEEGRLISNTHIATLSKVCIIVCQVLVESVTTSDGSGHFFVVAQDVLLTLRV